MYIVLENRGILCHDAARWRVTRTVSEVGGDARLLSVVLFKKTEDLEDWAHGP